MTNDAPGALVILDSGHPRFARPAVILAKFVSSSFLDKYVLLTSTGKIYTVVYRHQFKVVGKRA